MVTPVPLGIGQREAPRKWQLTRGKQVPVKSALANLLNPIVIVIFY
jgi:hypothetical protein